MKKNKKIIIALIAIALLCSAFTAGRGLFRFSNQENDVRYFVDPATGVNYILFYKTGYKAGGGGICVRVNPDGSPMVTK